MSNTTARARLLRAGFCAAALLALPGLPGLWGMTGMTGLHAANTVSAQERAQQKKEAEKERAGLRQRLQALKQEIDRTESARDHAADALAASEKAVSDSQRRLHQLDQQRHEVDRRIAELGGQHRTLSQNISQRRAQLGAMLREQYQAGGDDRTRLLLSGDNPNRVSRELQYFGYVSRAQTALITQLQADLAVVASNTEETRAAQEELAAIASQQQQVQARLEKEKSKRATLLASLSDKLNVQRRQVGSLQRDEQRLAQVVERLGKLIEQQRQAEQAAAQKRAQQLARQRAAQRDSKGKAPRQPVAAADAIDADENPAKSTARRAEPAAENPVQSGYFVTQRGRLALPVKGDLTGRFGAKRGEGSHWKGIFIRAAEGSPVKAVAHGRVAYAEWLRGFGNLIIVDHGDQYMSIYGNNQAVLKQPGDRVRSGEVIATAGNSGGNEFSGLYFEMRLQGRAIDPLAWMASR